MNGRTGRSPRRTTVPMKDGGGREDGEVTWQKRRRTGEGEGGQDMGAMAGGVAPPVEQREEIYDPLSTPDVDKIMSWTSALQFLQDLYKQGVIDPNNLENPTRTMNIQPQGTNQAREPENPDESYLVTQRSNIPFDVSSQYTKHLLDLNVKTNRETPTDISEILDWKDDTWRNLDIIALEHLSVNQICKLGEKTFSEIHGNMTKKTIRGILVLAYNLMDFNDEKLTDSINDSMVNIPGMIQENDLSDEILVSSPIKDMTPNYEARITDRAKNIRSAKAYCYLAASYLRLFTKSPDKFLKIGTHLKARFENFFAFPLPFDDFQPSSGAVEAIRKQFDLDERVRKTLYVLIYCSKQELKKGAQLKNFLFQLHLNFTGMHAMDLLSRLLGVTGLNSNQILSAIYIPAFRKQVEGMNAIGRMIKARDGYQKEMWKCARVFDHKFLSQLQTKNCVLFCLTLAYMVYQYGGDSAGGVLKIAHIKNAGIAEKKMAYALARFGVMRLNRIRVGPGLEAIATAAHL